MCRCILDAYILREKHENDVITIESDSEDDNEILLTEANIGVNNRYSELLKSLERQYPTVFDKVIKDIMQGQDKNLSASKRKSLKTILGRYF